MRGRWSKTGGLPQTWPYVPLRAKEGGVLVRDGHTEATVDLVKLAGLKPCGLCCEIMREDGTMMRTTELLQFAEQHDLTVITIADIIEYLCSMRA